MSLSRSQTPPGGWQFHVPQTGWSAPTPVASTFDQTVQLIIKHRLANPAITAKHNLSTDTTIVGKELEAFTRLRLGLPADDVPKTVPPRSLSAVVAGAVAGVSRVTEGAAPLIEWLDSGGQAVAPEISSVRASICATCPKNGAGDFTKWFTVPVSEAIRHELSKRQDLQLQTAFDDKLGVCSVCLCPLRLKCHSPIEIIAKHLKAERRAELPEFCWILKESA